MRSNFDDVIRYGKRASSDNSWLKRALFRYGKRADDVTEEDVMRALYQSGMVLGVLKIYPNEKYA